MGFCFVLHGIASHAHRWGASGQKQMDLRCQERLIGVAKKSSLSSSKASRPPLPRNRQELRGGRGSNHLTRSKRLRGGSSHTLGIADVSEEHADGEPKALDLNDMKVAELRELARARRMKGYSRLKKSELIDRLKGV
ncbi:hypothetical protein [Oryza sativa Japonica Group]|uniref:Os01g0205300 protein n=2 Tax=Oryza TaxID=4527 RepID=Q5QNL6_ORYSJ|nr:hypothetical protein [Oryza sativa Japonica Group]BAF04252.1 Os01g0205300 [Oryza sativa Japonica Group]|eukprot:NP_001042338.1 Os01g0205300 [Oryza sativa Japonica Group]